LYQLFVIYIFLGRNLLRRTNTGIRISVLKLAVHYSAQCGPSINTFL